VNQACSLTAIASKAPMDEAVEVQYGVQMSVVDADQKRPGGDDGLVLVGE
jgi:hypothetical protein